MTSLLSKMSTVIPAVLLLASVIFIPVYAAAPCSCADISNIKHRIEEAQVAIHTLETQIGFIDPVTPTREDTYAGLQGLLQAALNTANYQTSAPGLGTAPGQRGPAATLGDCSMVFSASASPCMLAVLKAHEQVHADECNRWKSVWNLITPWQYNLTLAQFARHEASSYRAELIYIDTMMQAAGLYSCPGMAPSPPVAVAIELKPITESIGNASLMEEFEVMR